MPQRIFNPISVPFMFFRNTTENVKDSPLTPYHRHDAFEIFLFLNGNRKMCIEKSCFMCRPGDMFIISPNQLHAGLCEEDCTYDRIVVNVKKQVLDGLSQKGVNLGECFVFENINQIKHTNLSVSERDEIIDLYEKYRRSIKAGGFGQSLLTETYMTQLLILVNRLFLSPSDKKESENLMPGLISDVMTYIHHHLAEEITLGGLAEKFYFDERYISKCFKQHTGITIREYIFDQRIELAKRQLVQGRNVSEACYASGFNDYANFLRSFKKHVGVSPGRYAKLRK